MGWQLRSRRLTRQAVCVLLKAGTATSSTRCPASPAERRAPEHPRPPPAPRRDRGVLRASPLSSLDWKRGALPQK